MVDTGKFRMETHIAVALQVGSVGAADRVTAGCAIVKPITDCP